MRPERRRMPGLGAVKVVDLRLPTAQPVTAPAPSAVTASAPAPTSSAPGFWSSASTGEKVAIVAGTGVTAWLLVLAFTPRRRRR